MSLNILQQRILLDQNEPFHVGVTPECDQSCSNRLLRYILFTWRLGHLAHLSVFGGTLSLFLQRINPNKGMKSETTALNKTWLQNVHRNTIYSIMKSDLANYDNSVSYS